MNNVQWVAILAGLMLLAISVFHLTLAAGFPFGAAAWGGQHRILPVKLRVGSVGAAAVLLGAGVVVLARADLLSPGAHSTVVRVVTWALAAFLALNTLGNLTSSSRVERVVMTPVAVTLAICFVIVAFA